MLVSWPEDCGLLILQPERHTLALLQIMYKIWGGKSSFITQDWDAAHCCDIMKFDKTLNLSLNPDPTSIRKVNIESMCIRGSQHIHESNVDVFQNHIVLFMNCTYSNS